MMHVLSSLRSRLTALVLLAVLPAFGVIIHSGLTQRELALLEAKSDLLRTLHFMAAREETLTEGAAHWLEALAQHPDLDRADLSRCPEFLKRVLRESGFVNLGVLDRHANLVCSAIPFAGPMHGAGEARYRDALQAGQHFESDYEIQPGTGLPAIVYSRLIADATGELSEVIFAERIPGGFSDLATHAQLPPDTTLTLIDRNGLVITHYPHPQRWVGKVLQDRDFLKTVAGQEQGFIEAVDIDGIPRLHAYLSLKGLQPRGVVLASMSLESIHSKSNEILFKNLLALAGVTFLVLLGARLFGDLLVMRNVNSLLDLASRLGHGELTARSGLRHGNGELNRLASAFDTMAQSLQMREEARRTAEESLQRSEESFRSLVENSPAGISIIQDHRVVYGNPEYERLLGRPFAQGRSVDFGGVHPDDLEAVQAFYDDLTSERVERADIHFRYHRASGDGESGALCWLYCVATGMRYGGRKAILINMTDVTRIKEMERLLGMQDRMASLGRVTAGIAHELRNPLSGINIHLTNLDRICGSEALSEEEIREQSAGIIRQLKGASNRIELVIRRVLDFSRPAQLRFIPVEVNRIIDDSVELCATTLRKGDIEITTSLAPGSPVCLGDPSSLQQALMNLITNALNTLRDWDGPKRLEVSSRVNESHVILRVADSGPGIPAHLAEKVFEPFFTTQKDGLGIGLSICHRIVADHGGTLKLAASRWGGAEFTIAIPGSTAHHESKTQGGGGE